MSQGRLGIGWEHPWDKPASGPGGPEGAPPRTSGKARRVLTSNRGTRIGAAKPSGSPGWERPTKENPFVFRKRLDELDLWALSEWETAQGEPR
jgi:hypothetical protein